MKILFELKKVTKPNYLPKLKTGVELFETGNGRFYVGNLKRGIELNGIPISLLRQFNGRRTIKQIADNTLVEIEAIERTIGILQEQELIDIYPTKMVFEDRFQSRIPGRPTSNGVFENDVAVRDFEQRIRSESSITAWREGANEGGKVLLSKRQEIQIKILGDDESSIALLLSLNASGFTNASVYIEREIEMDDTRTGIFNLNDVGAPIKNVVERIQRERQLFKSDQNSDAKTLIINFGNPGEKAIQQWLSDEATHLVVQSIGPNLYVGPLVIPGKTPCLNCVAMVDTKILKNLKTISDYQRPAIGALNWIIGYLTLAISEFIDTGNSPLLGCAKVFDSTDPNMIRDIKYPRHPSCGCNWL